LTTFNQVEEEKIESEIVQHQEQVIEQEEKESVEPTQALELNKDFEQEKEPKVIADIEERHVIDEIEKDLQLEVETEDTDDMDSQLNPDAKEFVPLTTGMQSPPMKEFKENGLSPKLANPILSAFDDLVVSQSPRKNDNLVMEDVQIPTENEFDEEADARPHEVNLLEENFQRIESPIESMNLKEAMQTDDKLDQAYTDEAQPFFEEEKQQQADDYKVLESSFDQYSNGFQSKIDDPMNRSFYEGRDSDILSNQTNDVLNTVQPIPSFEDEKQSEFDHNNLEKDFPEADLLGGGEPMIEQDFTLVEHSAPQLSKMELSDNFEAEHFIEEIKKANENFNKYDDTELSMQVPDFPIENETFMVSQTPLTVNPDKTLDTFIVDTSTASNIEIPEQNIIAESAPLQNEMKDIPEVAETIEAVQETSKPEEIITESKVAEVVGATTVLVAAAGVAAVAVAGKAKAPEPKKTAAKAPPKPATSTAAKKTEIKPKAPITKPSSAPVKPPVSKTAVKPATAAPASATARPKTTVSSVPPVKKAAPVTKTETKPPATKPSVPATRPITKRPATTSSIK
jgi:Ataxin-2 C-terminal region